MCDKAILAESLVKPEADILRNRILNAPDRIPAKGTKWFISPNGNDNCAGNSPGEAWGSIKALTANASSLKSGDAVLFERGGVYRGGFTAVSGVFYGAYNEGAKPCIYASKADYAKAIWTKMNDDLWMLEDETISDVGLIVFNHGEKVGVKKMTQEEVRDPFDFYGAYNGRLYLRLKQDPASFQSIEIGDLTHVILMPRDTKDVTFENLTVKYGGGHGIVALDNAEKIMVRGCEVGWIGGSLLPNYKDGSVRFGNGIEFWNGGKDILVENCWIYQVYDSGLSHQGNGVYMVENLMFKDNLVEHCCLGSIEYWLDNGTKNKMKNVSYSGNILRFVGYGWGMQRPDKQIPAHLVAAGGCDNLAENFTVIGNVFELSSNMLVRVPSKAGTYPVFKGNTYIQIKDGALGRMVNEECLSFDEDAENHIRKEFKDQSATLRYY